MKKKIQTYKRLTNAEEAYNTSDKRIEQKVDLNWKGRGRRQHYALREAGSNCRVCGRRARTAKEETSTPSGQRSQSRVQWDDRHLRQQRHNLALLQECAQ